MAAGAVAAKLLESLGITVQAYTSAVGPVKIDHSKMDLEEISNNRLYMPDKKAAAEAESYLEDMIQRKDSCGGVIECVVNGLPAGVGEPVFDKLDADRVSQIIQIVSSTDFGQVFVTDTNREHIDEILQQHAMEYKIFHVERGEVMDL